MERVDERKGGGIPQDRGEPRAHLRSCLVGESDRQNASGGNACLQNQAGDAPGQGVGLACAGAGRDQKRAAFVFHHSELLVIEVFEITMGRRLAWQRRIGDRGRKEKILWEPLESLSKWRKPRQHPEPQKEISGPGGVCVPGR